MWRAECGTTKTAPDPLLDWVWHGLRGKDTFKPLPEPPSPSREAFFRWLICYEIQFGMNRGGAFALIDKKTKKVCAAAITCPPRCVSFSKSLDEMGSNCRVA